MTHLETTITALDQKDFNSVKEKEALNAQLMLSEQTLMNKEGLPRRPWYRHQIYAPGFYTGYGVKTLPGVREAIEQENWEECQQQIILLSQTIKSFDKHLQMIFEFK